MAGVTTPEAQTKTKHDSQQPETNRERVIYKSVRLSAGQGDSNIKPIDKHTPNAVFLNTTTGVKHFRVMVTKIGESVEEARTRLRRHDPSAIYVTQEEMRKAVDLNNQGEKIDVQQSAISVAETNQHGVLPRMMMWSLNKIKVALLIHGSMSIIVDICNGLKSTAAGVLINNLTLAWRLTVTKMIRKLLKWVTQTSNHRRSHQLTGSLQIDATTHLSVDGSVLKLVGYIPPQSTTDILIVREDPGDGSGLMEAKREVVNEIVKQNEKGQSYNTIEFGVITMRPTKNRVWFNYAKEATKLLIETTIIAYSLTKICKGGANLKSTSFKNYMMIILTMVKLCLTQDKVNAVNTLTQCCKEENTTGDKCKHYDEECPLIENHGKLGVGKHKHTDIQNMLSNIGVLKQTDPGLSATYTCV